MRKLTLQEQQWVESAYPLVKQTMERYGLSKNDTIDWHGELSVALCEAVIENSPYSKTDLSVQTFVSHWIEYANCYLEDRVRLILKSEQYRFKEIPSGLRPHRTVGGGAAYKRK